MIDYYLYLLRDFTETSNALQTVQKFFNVDSDAPKMLINTVLDTDLNPYLSDIIDYKQEKYKDVNSNIDLIVLDQQVAPFAYLIKDQELNNIYHNHFTSIWRVSAFVVFYILEANKYYHANNTTSA